VPLRHRPRADGAAIGDTRPMDDIPSTTLYHRTLGWHAPALRRAVIVAAIGLVVTLVLVWFVPWELAIVGGWDAAMLAFLIAVWSLIARADGARTARLATRVDETRGLATALLAGASVVSLLGVGFVLIQAGTEAGPTRAVLVGVAVVTVVLSWVMVNTVFTLHYAHQHFAAGGDGIAFAAPVSERPPDYREFAYLAFTVGMTYQVSDTTPQRRRIRRTVLAHALLSYMFGVVIVAGAINLIAGLLR
jgi:uncharacterized membrane protein